jgi:thiamine biosynthesis lipoprotein
MTTPDRAAGPSRRQFLALAAGAFVVAAVPFSRRMGIAGGGGLVRRTVPAMGATADFAVRHPDARHAQRALDAAIAEMRRIESLMTRFHPDSDVGRANRLARHDAVPVSADTHAVLLEAVRWAEATNGEFDPSLAVIQDLWDVKHRHAPPPPSAVGRLAGRRLYRHLDVGTLQGRPVVRYGDPDVQLDLGGIACGYGVDRAVAVLRAWGIRDGYINASGDIYALGTADDGEPWKVGVRSPSDPTAIVATIPLSDGAIATSGDYEQFFDYGGRRYSHILDPGTAEPRRTPVHSVTISAPTCLAADAASTACFGVDRDAAMAFLPRVSPGAEVVDVA